jgi:hypothetical protein
MCRPREEISKHDLALMKFNNLMIDVKLHLAGVRVLDDKAIAQLDKYAADIREDLERCKAFGMKY